MEVKTVKTRKIQNGVKICKKCHNFGPNGIVHNLGPNLWLCHLGSWARGTHQQTFTDFEHPFSNDHISGMKWTFSSIPKPRINSLKKDQFNRNSGRWAIVSSRSGSLYIWWPLTAWRSSWPQSVTASVAWDKHNLKFHHVRKTFSHSVSSYEYLCLILNIPIRDLEFIGTELKIETTSPC